MSKTTKSLTVKSSEIEFHRAVRVAASVTGVPEPLLLSRSRNEKVAWARHLAYFLARWETEASYPEIGRFFKRDHGSIWNGIRRVQNASISEPERWSAVEFSISLLNLAPQDKTCPCCGGSGTINTISSRAA